MDFISHPMNRPDTIEKREYQLAIAMKALDANTMVILPTSLGKTAVALLVAASRLHNDGGKVLMPSPLQKSRVVPRLPSYFYNRKWSVTKTALCESLRIE